MSVCMVHTWCPPMIQTIAHIVYVGPVFLNNNDAICFKYTETGNAYLFLPIYSPYILYTWALQRLPYHTLGLSAYTILVLHGAFWSEGRGCWLVRGSAPSCLSQELRA